MKTIIEKDTKLSKYLLEDTDRIAINRYAIRTVDFVIGDMNSSNAEIIENVVPPIDWKPCEYTYDAANVGNEWQKVIIKEK